MNKEGQIFLQLATISAAIAVLESQTHRHLPLFRPDNTLPSYDDVVNHEKEKEAAGIEPPTYEEALKMIGADKKSNVTTNSPDSHSERQSCPAYARSDSSVLPNVPDSSRPSSMTSPTASSMTSPTTPTSAQASNQPTDFFEGQA